MKANGIPARPENGNRHDAYIVLDTFDEFAIVIPHLIRHLQKRENATDGHLSSLINRRRVSFNAVQEQILSGAVDEGTLEIMLTPIESEAVAGRLQGSEKDVVTEEEVSLGVLIHSHLAHEYIEQLGIKPANYVPLTREPFEQTVMQVS